MADRSIKVRRRVGVARFHDGWNVVIEWTLPRGRVERQVFDPTFATEAEAEAKAAETSAALAEVDRKHGVATVSSSDTNGRSTDA